MTNSHDPVWVTCEEIGCPNGTAVHWRLADTFAGRFHCPDHPEVAEVTHR